MAAVLRALAPDSDIDAFLATCKWNITRVFRSDGLAHARQSRASGFNAVVSNANLDDFSGQAEDAVRFLQTQHAKVRDLMMLSGEADVTIDFAIRALDGPMQSVVFPRDLIAAAATCGVALQLSWYATR